MHLKLAYLLTNGSKHIVLESVPHFTTRKDSSILKMVRHNWPKPASITWPITTHHS